jgi:hypothetical protein
LIKPGNTEEVTEPLSHSPLRLPWWAKLNPIRSLHNASVFVTVALFYRVKKMRYSAVPLSDRIVLRDKFNVWGNKTRSFVRPFQNDYTDVIHMAVDLAKNKRVPDNLDYDEGRRAKYNLAPVVYGFGDDNIQVYILPAGIEMPGHGRGDVAALHLKKEPYSQVVLYGETGKQWLDRGVADFVIPAKDIGRELEDIMIAWKNFSIKNFDLDARTDTAKKLADGMSLHDPVDFVTTYLYPVIPQGFNQPEIYEQKLKGLLLNSQPNPEQQITTSPVPFVKIRSFE